MESQSILSKRILENAKSNIIEFDKNALFDYLKSLLTNTRTCQLPALDLGDKSTSIDENIKQLIDEILNCKITLEEVQKMVYKLKTGKATKLDLVTAELLRNFNENFLLFSQNYSTKYLTR